jgi:hypothetical protein
VFHFSAKKCAFFQAIDQQKLQEKLRLRDLKKAKELLMQKERASQREFALEQKLVLQKERAAFKEERALQKLASQREKEQRERERAVRRGDEVVLQVNSSVTLHEQLSSNLKDALGPAVPSMALSIDSAEARGPKHQISNTEEMIVNATANAKLKAKAKAKAKRKAKRKAKGKKQVELKVKIRIGKGNSNGQEQLNEPNHDHDQSETYHFGKPDDSKTTKGENDISNGKNQDTATNTATAAAATAAVATATTTAGDSAAATVAHSDIIEHRDRSTATDTHDKKTKAVEVAKDKKQVSVPELVQATEPVKVKVDGRGRWKRPSKVASAGKATKSNSGPKVVQPKSGVSKSSSKRKRGKADVGPVDFLTTRRHYDSGVRMFESALGQVVPHNPINVVTPTVRRVSKLSENGMPILQDLSAPSLLSRKKTAEEDLSDDRFEKRHRSSENAEKKTKKFQSFTTQFELDQERRRR